MAINRQKKKEVIEQSNQDLKESRSLIFVDFAGVQVNDLNALRITLLQTGSRLRVIKKRLLKVIFKGGSSDFDPLKYQSQVGTVFVGGELTETAGLLYRFSKEHEGFRLLGALDLEKSEELDEAMINAIGSLPSREILLGQLLSTIVAPLRALMFILSQKSKA